MVCRKNGEFLKSHIAEQAAGGCGSGEKEYVEFLVGRNGEFDLLAASVIHRCKRTIRGDNSAMVWVMPYLPAGFEKTRKHTESIMMKLRSVNGQQTCIIKWHFKKETDIWLNVPIL